MVSFSLKSFCGAGSKCSTIKGKKHNVMVMVSNQEATANSLSPALEKLSRLNKKNRNLQSVIIKKTIPKRENKVLRPLKIVRRLFIE